MLLRSTSISVHSMFTEKMLNINLKKSININQSKPAYSIGSLFEQSKMPSLNYISANISTKVNYSFSYDLVNTLALSLPLQYLLSYLSYFT